MTPDIAIFSWLQGFTDDPMQPIIGGTRSKLYDFDASRVKNLRYSPAGKPGVFYIYIPSYQYQLFPYVTQDVPGSQLMPVQPPPSGTAADFMNPTSATNRPYLNPDTVQILCAGLDEVFGTDDDLSNCWPGTRKQYLDSLKQ